METISFDEALAAMEAVVAERGEDYVYPKQKRGWSHEDQGLTCLYALDGDPSQPACIVGAVLAHEGKLTKTIANQMSTVSDLVEQGLLTVSEKTERLLKIAQFEQDGGSTWGWAVAKAKKAAGV